MEGVGFAEGHVFDSVLLLLLLEFLDVLSEGLPVEAFDFLRLFVALVEGAQVAYF